MEFTFDAYALRMPAAHHAEGLVRITHDREAMRYYGEGASYFEDIEAALPQIKWMQEVFDLGGGRWIITEKDSDVYIGDIGFNNYEAYHRRVEIGYRLCRAYWGKGVITRAIGVLVDWGFTARDYNRIEALVDVRNPGSKIVLLRNGFIKEGTLRDYEFEHGHFVDLEMYALLKRDHLKARQDGHHVASGD